ncbi:GNAT family N-acetyltransferase [Mycobacterium sp.]|uniref:GNAT family N-acetyltransferase n=1 Tax=Mycobacterium sp. TaxID=1785 RepID=UPI002C287C04|nr:GNAT family N-acetyltransferase [Mycobacterium sp.]HTQ22194.1 GNAT family N-acetyltransferase [Mycobacterium sp.]
MSTLGLRRRGALDREALSGKFSLRRVDPDRDLDLVHAWMNDPDVALFWKMPWARHAIASYLRRQDRNPNSTPYLGELNGVPMSYWELYRADLEPIAQRYAAREHDAGLHLLLGNPEYRGRGLAVDLLRAVSSWQLNRDPRVTRVVAEPDIDNKRSIRAFERAGFRRTRVIDLPDKRAALMVRDRTHHRPNYGGTTPVPLRTQRSTGRHRNY